MRVIRNQRIKVINVTVNKESRESDTSCNISKINCLVDDLIPAAIYLKSIV